MIQEEKERRNRNSGIRLNREETEERKCGQRKKREVKYIKYAGRGMTKLVKARGKKEGEAKCKNVQKKEISRKETGREK